MSNFGDNNLIHILDLKVGLKKSKLAAMRMVKILTMLGLLLQNPCSLSTAIKDVRDTPITYRGLSFVAPPKPFPSDPMSEVKQIGANAIAVIPYGFTRIGTPSVRYNQSEWQWWGERPVGVIETIRQAHRTGIDVMLKPQIYIPGSWTGEMEFNDANSWSQWEYDYQSYILDFAQIADSLQVKALCIGTEFRKSVTQRASFWFDLIKKVRKIYDGQLTYAANWDDFKDVPFWGELDFIGINAYFPLDESPTPLVDNLIRKWQPYCQEIESFHQSMAKPIVFTEYGYLSVDGCAYNTWDLEKNIKDRPINEQAQANALEALYQVFGPKKYWEGGFLWKWFPNGAGHEGYVERDYTPQNKLAYQSVNHYYTASQSK